MNNAGRTMEKLKDRIGVRHVNNRKNYLKCKSKPNQIPKKIFDNVSQYIKIKLH